MHRSAQYCLGLLLVAAPAISVIVLPTSSRAQSCVGDCSADSQVTVDEILTMVNIALGNAAVADCMAGDNNQDGQITVDEIVTALDNALNGCSTDFTWALQNPMPTNSDLFGLSFIDSQSGWAVGALGDIGHTTDGGRTWEGQETDTTVDLLAVKFVDSQSGWIAGDM